jgi:hypothetical protein
MRDLVNELQSADRFARRCAADLARRLSAREAGILRSHAGLLMDLAAGLPDDEWQARGWVTLAAAGNVSTHGQRMRLAGLLRPMLEDKRVGLRAMALEAFVTMAEAEPRLREEAMPRLERALRDGPFALRVRARRLLGAPSASVFGAAVRRAH